jgi:hypothetical protein
MQVFVKSSIYYGENPDPGNLPETWGIFESPGKPRRMRRQGIQEKFF